MKRIILLGFVPVLLLVISCGGREKEEEPKQIESSQLKQTIITPHMEADISTGKSLIYCSTFQIAWNMLQDNVIGEEIRLEGNPPIAEALNKKLSTTEDIAKESCLSMAGKVTEKFIKNINREMKRKFGYDSQLAKPENLNQNAILVYSYIYKNLMFKTEFEPLDEPLEFYLGNLITEVSAFGIEEFTSSKKEHQQLAKQVAIYSYEENWDEDERSFIIGLKSTAENDEIILAMVKPQKTLLETVKSVDAKIKGAVPDKLAYNDTLQIPKIDFNLKHSYDELKNITLMNERWRGWYISAALQIIRFRLDERGALLKSEVLIEPQSEPRFFIFDKPFLLYLKQKGAKYPYLAMWVGNAELLIKK